VPHPDDIGTKDGGWNKLPSFPSQIEAIPLGLAHDHYPLIGKGVEFVLTSKHRGTITDIGRYAIDEIIWRWIFRGTLVRRSNGRVTVGIG